MNRKNRDPQWIHQRSKSLVCRHRVGDFISPLSIDIRHHRRVVRIEEDEFSLTSSLKLWRDLKTAQSSRKLICSMDSRRDHVPLTIRESRWPPHPERDASVVKVSWKGGCGKKTPHPMSDCCSFPTTLILTLQFLSWESSCASDCKTEQTKIV